MRLEPVQPGDDKEEPLGKRLLWFFGIAFVSMLVVAAVAYTLRGFLLIG
ncbi:MAG: hypothetical protein GYB49_09880 [Alphaproteobacteria bacterium]|nr:hypothetical protein [Alphaproteobacteria bacterium]|tara:strand:+ start:6895 stop:7041 length:147 start_codon:yes stop_codon:yes gene_type:complete